MEIHRDVSSVSPELQLEEVKNGLRHPDDHHQTEFSQAQKMVRAGSEY